MLSRREKAMRLGYSMGAAVAALGMGLFAPALAHMGAVGAVSGNSAIASTHTRIGGHVLGFGVKHVFPRPTNQFHHRHFHARTTQFAGGYGDNADDDYDIEDLHFRVQEPFGPGDIGRPPIPGDENVPYMPERPDLWQGYGQYD